jgi:hypothetical protein
MAEPTATAILVAHIKEERKARMDTEAKNCDVPVLEGITDILGGKHNSLADITMMFLGCFLPPELITDGGFLQRRVSDIKNTPLYE